ncbi:hypothetical protein [Lysinibacillus sp. G4S2]|uniref:hypothetical protein n=1 Tax=Lysinibacillus sp. G4S2 TaxID=3055859 RepID=UPI0025A201FD|nr:hypothetical protein [Lysinibacillus sp. G4S2]MDM5247881.1 hypothetical protein [Lysinibacillus sp. G4S2]
MNHITSKSGFFRGWDKKPHFSEAKVERGATAVTKSLMGCSFEICRELLIVYRPTLSIYHPTFEKYRHLPSCNTF